MKSNRRKFIRNLGTGVAGLTLSTTVVSMASSGSSVTKKEVDGQVLFIGDNIALADTTYGKVRGFIMKDIYTFLGIPYGADTTGKNRFMPPQKPEPWKDVFPAVYWPNASPQLLDNFYADRYLAFTDYWHYDDISENCLGINVWTPEYKDNTKRPVLLWIHGGGFTSGNSIEHPEYHGENLSRQGNIVFCSLNHRLGPLGFSDFSGVGGDKYAASGNVGMLDIIAGLEWIRDNISNFGGDPDNVTIIGQSGGGSKVCTTIAMPSARGLVSKAVVLSGRSMDLRNKDLKSRAGEYILREAGLNAGQVDELQQMPWRKYYDLALSAAEKLLKDVGIKSLSPLRVFLPQIDGKYIPQHPFFPEISPNAANIPMIICSTLNETSPSFRDSSLESISLEGVKEKIFASRNLPGLTKDFSGLTMEKTGEMVNAYATAFPDKKPVEIWSMITTDRQRVVLLADAKSKQKPPVFTAWFGWNPPVFDGRLRAFHTMDIGFWFYNTDVQISHTGGGARPRDLAAKMSGSLVQFMKTGDPNGGGLPHWPQYTTSNGELLLLDDACIVQNDPDREARKYLPDPEGYFNVRTI